MTTQVKVILGPEEIKKLIPHRYPFLFIDNVLEIAPKTSILAAKTLFENEPFFAGHFPGNPIFPGVLAVEAMAQAAGILFSYSLLCLDDKVPGQEQLDQVDPNLFYLTVINSAKFRRLMKPGDELTIRVGVLQASSRMWKLGGEILVGGQKTCEAEFSALIKN